MHVMHAFLFTCQDGFVLFMRQPPENVFVLVFDFF